MPYSEGIFDTNIAPGMSLPTDLPALISLRAQAHVDAIEAEFPDETSIETLGEHGEDNHVCRAQFSHVDENPLKVRRESDK